MGYIILSLSIINLLLGIVILIHSKHEKENIIFLLFDFCVSLWTFNNFYLRINTTTDILRISYGLGVIVAISYLIWLYVLLRKRFPRFVLYFVIPFSIVLFYLTIFTNLIIEDLYSLTLFGYEGKLGTFFPLYTLYFSLIIIIAIRNLIKGRRETSDPIKKNQISNILLGALFFACVSFFVSFWIPTVLNTLRYTILDNFSFSILLLSTVYAIVKHGLFINRKIILTEIFIFALWISLLIRTVIVQGTYDTVINGLILIFTVIIGTFLIRSVIQEVELREKVEILAKDLEKSNEQQTTLIHFISHEIKGFLTKSRNIFSIILDEDYGPTPEYLRVPVHEGLESDTKGVAMVQEILSASNLKKGTIQYAMKPFDLGPVVLNTIADLKGNADAKGLYLETIISPHDTYDITGDEEQIRHVLRNLIDNSIKYTVSGGVRVGLSKRDGSILITVRDTGVGIDPEDRPRLFTEGGNGKNSIKVNVDSTGYGLYIAKKIVDAHKGRIWVESDGAGKGSTFFVELPTK